MFVVSLMVPELRGRAAASSSVLVVDGREVARRDIGPGSVSFKVPVEGCGRHRVQLKFDRADPLPSPDNRLVSAQIRYIGFQPDVSGLTTARYRSGSSE